MYAFFEKQSIEDQLAPVVELQDCLKSSPLGPNIHALSIAEKVVDKPLAHPLDIGR
jgi:hypothetical protein